MSMDTVAGKCEAQWQHLTHGADIGVRGKGVTLEEAFVQAALALTAIVCDPRGVRPDTPVEIRCSAPNPELLLMDWLNDLIFESATRHMLFGRFRVRIRGDELTATAWGEAVDPARHQPAVEPKGATLTGLRVARDPQGCWRAECIIDV